MLTLNPFNLPGKWYKGNLHCHTAESDGALSPSELYDWYLNHEYSFISITDHNRVTFTNGDRSKLITIPGVEISCRQGLQEYHVIGIDVKEMPIQPFHTPQETIDAINACGGSSIIAHPYWHDLQLEDLLPLRGHMGIEIFNTSCWIDINKGHSLAHWDALLRRGPSLWGFASDDAHFKIPDYGGGWIMVKSKELESASILEAIRQGNFYSSMGPEIYDMHIENNYLHISCSPVRSIYILGQCYFSPRSINVWDDYSGNLGTSQLLVPESTNGGITEASSKLDPRQEILRVEIVDFYGRSAWSNPYFKNTGQIHWD
jgi:hypothetical protein